jgi:adenylate cyclase
MEDLFEVKGALMIADLSGYTALTQIHGNYTSAEIFSKYSTLIKSALEPDCKLLEQVGDNVLIFSENVENLIKTSQNLILLSTQEENFLLVHIGIDYGEILMDDNEIFGSVINIASRISNLASGGQILCTERIRERISDRDDLFRKFGSHQFKNLTGKLEVFEILIPSSIPDKKLDPVCRMLIDISNPSAVFNYNGEEYYFCSEQCKRIFTETPESYIKPIKIKPKSKNSGTNWLNKLFRK